MMNGHKCSICGEFVDFEGGWLHPYDFKNWVCLDCIDWVCDDLEKPPFQPPDFIQQGDTVEVFLHVWSYEAIFCGFGWNSAGAFIQVLKSEEKAGKGFRTIPVKYLKDLKLVRKAGELGVNRR
jgi:hypothetical protein